MFLLSHFHFNKHAVTLSVLLPEKKVACYTQLVNTGCSEADTAECSRKGPHVVSVTSVSCV